MQMVQLKHLIFSSSNRDNIGKLRRIDFFLQNNVGEQKTDSRIKQYRPLSIQFLGIVSKCLEIHKNQEHFLSSKSVETYTLNMLNQYSALEYKFSPKNERAYYSIQFTQLYHVHACICFFFKIFQTQTTFKQL